jgi:hypothetical protein
MSGRSKPNAANLKKMPGGSGEANAPSLVRPQNPIKTASLLSTHPRPTSLFELAARMDVSTPVGPPYSVPEVNQAMFAALREEAEHATAQSGSPKRLGACSSLRLTFPMDTIRAAAFRRTLQRKLAVNAACQP